MRLQCSHTGSPAPSSSASGDAPAEPGAARDQARAPVRDAAEDPPTASRRTRGRRETPLFDQYEGEDRPRAANE